VSADGVSITLKLHLLLPEQFRFGVSYFNHVFLCVKPSLLTTNDNLHVLFESFDI
jgi:hypothetical protein